MTDAESNLFDEIKENKVSDRGANYYGSSTRIPERSAGARPKDRKPEPTVVS